MSGGLLDEQEVRLDLGLGGRVALITGGSRGLGRQTALSLASEGVAVAVTGRSRDSLDQTVADVRALGVRAIGVTSDAFDLSGLEDLHRQVVEGLGPVDILVNNVGGSGSKDDWVDNMVNRPVGSRPSENIETTPVEGLRRVLDVNLFGGFALTRLVLPHMIGQRWGRIVNIASVWGREYGSNIAYMTSKAALIAAAKHTAVSVAKHGVLVNSIAPGMIEAPGGMWERATKEHSEETMQRFYDQVLPMVRFGWPEPVGDLIAFLCSDRAGMITGACIPVDGAQGVSMI